MEPILTRVLVAIGQAAVAALAAELVRIAKAMTED